MNAENAFKTNLFKQAQENIPRSFSAQRTKETSLKTFTTHKRKTKLNTIGQGLF